MRQAMMVAALLVISLAGVAHAQPAPPQSVPPDVMKGLAKDLANLQSKLDAAQREAQASPVADYHWVKVTAADAPVHAGADTKTKVMFTAAQDKSFPVLDKAGDWYAIGFGQNPRKDTGWVRASDVAPFQAANTPFIQYEDMLRKYQQGSTPPSAASDQSALDRVYEAITEEASAIRDKYANNKYIRVTGFAVNVGIPPSVSMNFEFKSTAK